MLSFIQSLFYLFRICCYCCCCFLLKAILNRLEEGSEKERKRQKKTEHSTLFAIAWEFPSICFNFKQFSAWLFCNWFHFANDGANSIHLMWLVMPYVSRITIDWVKDVKLCALNSKSESVLEILTESKMVQQYWNFFMCYTEVLRGTEKLIQYLSKIYSHVITYNRNVKLFV